MWYRIVRLVIVNIRNYVNFYCHNLIIFYMTIYFFGNTRYTKTVVLIRIFPFSINHCSGFPKYGIWDKENVKVKRKYIDFHGFFCSCLKLLVLTHDLKYVKRTKKKIVDTNVPSVF